ncbi:DUF2510 domain-containing protein [Mycolicibacterium diernhoferi]|uniref:DUF2510 domain-containing protein n=1 Tax=Mycolicibacterium diernhoferi TaxID=1801 RepID=A0A1T3W4R3_9MYCO|nr:DUF2510 domain-containing protein [Mycolicibacterium diernhoferi]OPE49324.1 hypothetical protein BV510_22490 [Mycolicibacterium diernhoferi]PEG52613.1 DUF2510 domain-containing protein [Mycolicibacterium diernhoferi]QYL23405.1 DUF2510 domain-containing protein [Mycolicibacterium diernhoferi]
MARSTEILVEGDVITDPTLPAAAGWFTDPWEPDRVRFFDGLKWTDQVAAASTAASGYPLGQRILFLREQAASADGDASCVLLDVHGAPLGAVSSRVRLPLAIGRDTRTIEFDVVNPAGRLLLTVARSGGRRDQRITIGDAGGHEVGRLSQTGSYWRRVRLGRLSMRLESSDRPLAQTTFHLDPTGGRGLAPQHVYDTVGAAIATVTPLHPAVTGPQQLLAYRLDCPQAVSNPLPTLLSAVLIARYLYDRLEYRGGWLDQAAYWVSRPSWHQ